MVNVTLAEKIHGWMSIAELRFLAEHASKSKIVLEAGSYKGRSTRAMADNLSPDSILHAIDPWDGTYDGIDDPRDDAFRSYQDGKAQLIRTEFYLNLFDHIVDRTVIMHQMPFHKIWIPDANMIFIDANHQYETTKRDILHAINLLCAGGLLCGHDYRNEWPGVIKAVDEVFGPGIQVFESIWWIKL